VRSFRFPNHWFVNALLLFFLGVLAPRAPAQSDTAGSLTGSITGPGGRSVPAAFIRIESPTTTDHSDTTSDAHGNFRFAAIPPGVYRLLIHAPGLSDWEADNLVLAPGTAVRLNPALAPLSLHRTILVDAQPQSAALQRNAAIPAADLAALPNNSQNPSTLAALFSAASPGSDGALSFSGLSPLMTTIALDGADNTLAFRARERGSGGNGFATTQSSVSQFQMSPATFAPEPGRAAISTITKSGSSRMRGQATFYDRGAIGQTFNAYDKVLQQEPAGTTITAAGQPVLYLNGQPITYVEVPYHAPDRRQEWDVSAGGPIRRDRLFWFFAWQQHQRDDPAVARASEPEVFFAPPSAPTLTTFEARLQSSRSPIAQSCASSGAPGAGSTAMAACAYATVLSQLHSMLGTVPRSTRQTILFPKLDWRVNTRNQLTLQFNDMRRNAPHSVLGGASEYDAIGSFGNSSTSDDAALARWDFFATPTLLNSVRVLVSRDVLAQSPAAPTSFEQQFAQNSWGLPAEVSLDRSAGFAFGTLDTVNKRAYPAESRQQFIDAASWIHGNHALRIGYDYNHIADALEGMNGENGAYSYASLLNFVSDLLAPDSCDGATTATGPYPCYSRYRQTLGASNWRFTTADYAAFIADEWKPLHRLTLTLGLRYDDERLPNPNAALVNATIPQTAALPHNRNDFSPRAAFAWDISGRNTTILRASYGLYYARVPNATVFSALTATGTAPSPRSYAWRPMDAGAPPFPYVFSANETPYTDPTAPDQASTAPDVVFFDPHFRHPQIDQADLTLEQSLGARNILTLTAMATNGHHLAQFLDTNIDLADTATVFYAIKAPGNHGDAGPLAKAAMQQPGSSFPIYAPQRFYYQRVNPNYGAITDILSESNSSYRGAMLRLVRRLSRTLTVNAGYTWSHAIDDNQPESAFAERNSVYDPADLALEHGTSSFDVRQRVAGGLVLREPWRAHGEAAAFFGGYSLAADGDWRTGLPWSMRTLGSPTPSCSYQDWLIAGGATGGGVNCLKVVQQPNAVITTISVPIASLGESLNGSGGEDLVTPIGRNTFRYPAQANLDLRLAKHIPLGDRCSIDLLADAFNALNHQNVTAMQTIGYRVVNDSVHANMATLTWQSGEKPATATTLINGSTLPQFAWDPTAAFAHVTNSNSSAILRERQLQAGIKLNF
jgi:Carboxypeptidase regulatory-like domain/TonB dependent receptor